MHALAMTMCMDWGKKERYHDEKWDWLSEWVPIFWGEESAFYCSYAPPPLLLYRYVSCNFWAGDQGWNEFYALNQPPSCNAKDMVVMKIGMVWLFFAKGRKRKVGHRNEV